MELTINKIIKVTEDNIDDKIIQQIIQILNQDGIIVYPTETAYGLGCDGFNINAIKKIYLIKQRKFDQPLPVIVSSLEMADKIAYLNLQAKKLIKTFHPGPLIVSLPKKELIPDILNPTGIAFRISKNKIIHQIVSEFNKPIVSTSANLSGKSAPYSIDDVKNQIKSDLINIFLDSGQLPINQPTTIVDFQLEPSPQITREGEITAKRIFEVLNIKKKLWNNHKQQLEK